MDTLVMKNNIYVVDATANQPGMIFENGAKDSIGYKDIDYNKYYKHGNKYGYPSWCDCPIRNLARHGI